jgi:hypothetical protein
MMPEPFIGDLLGRPKAILLGNNPGAGHETWQGRDGRFVREVLQIGFTAWAKTRAYDSAEWEARARCKPLRPSRLPRAVSVDPTVAR